MILLLQEFDVELRDKKGAENCVADHLSRLPVDHIDESNEAIPINDSRPDESLLAMEERKSLADIIEGISTRYLPYSEDKHVEKRNVEDYRPDNNDIGTILVETPIEESYVMKYRPDSTDIEPISVLPFATCATLSDSRASEIPWYADFANYIVGGEIPAGLTSNAKKKFLHDVKQYYWEDPYLFKQGSDHVFRRCIPY